jgi:hypothetical protein
LIKASNYLINKLNQSNLLNDSFILSNENKPKGFENFWPKSNNSSDKKSEENKPNIDFKKMTGGGGSGSDK